MILVLIHSFPLLYHVVSERKMSILLTEKNHTNCTCFKQQFWTWNFQVREKFDRRKLQIVEKCWKMLKSGRITKKISGRKWLTKYANIYFVWSQSETQHLKILKKMKSRYDHLHYLISIKKKPLPKKTCFFSHPVFLLVWNSSSYSSSYLSELVSCKSCFNFDLILSQKFSVGSDFHPK